MAHGELPRLMVITDRRVARGRGLEDVVARACEGGARLVQLREKDLDGRPLLALTRALREITDRYGATLLVNDRVDVALAAGADGIVLPASSFPTADARSLVGPGRIVGRSTHSPEEVAAAAREGCDFVLFGPIHETPAKTAFGPPQGPDRLRAAACLAAIPLFAVGGVDNANTASARRAGAWGVAVIRAVMAADDPAKAVAALLETLA